MLNICERPVLRRVVGSWLKVCIGSRVRRGGRTCACLCSS